MTRMHVSRDQLATKHFGDYESRATQLGDYYLKFATIPAGFDDRELVEGLPEDACHSEHWGYVFKGKLRFRYTDGTEDIIEAGEAYYIRPGHTFDVIEDTETVEFSPRQELDRTTETLLENLESSQH